VLQQLDPLPTPPAAPQLGLKLQRSQSCNGKQFLLSGFQSCHLLLTLLLQTC
jgi:hypothetical protein